MEYSLSNHIINIISECKNNTECILIDDSLSCKKRKLEKVIEGYDIGSVVDCHLEYSYENVANYKEILPCQDYRTSDYHPVYRHSKNINKNVSFPRTRGRIFQKNICMKKMGYWGPLLRYGTYGIYKKFEENIVLKKKWSPEIGKIKDNRLLKEQLRQPIEIPLNVKIPRQAMICTLQSHSKLTLNDLKKLERDKLLHMAINYSVALEQLTNKCGTCPKYIYTKVNDIPKIEREYFTSIAQHDNRKTYLSIDCSRHIEIKPISEYFACELFISDIIIAQGFALWKRRARETCARKAFKVLEQPCYIIGSTRYWCYTDFLTVCLTDDLQTVNMLPPFLTDPTEPLFKKDDNINKSNPEDNFDILNPKSIEDFWLYAPTLLDIATIKDIDPQVLLYQSAEFSQMNISFEIETCFDESFSCTILIDKSVAVTVDGLGSLEQARQAASLVLVDKLIDTQPIVVLQEEYHAQYNDIVTTGHYSQNHFIVRTLMWSPDDSHTAVPFHLLSDIVHSESGHSTDTDTNMSSKDRVCDLESLGYFLNLYAQSSIVNSLIIHSGNVCDHLWSFIADSARLSGLLVLHGCDTNTDSLFISKQVPHKQLKSFLFTEKQFGVFRLLCDGSLSDSYLSDLRGFQCVCDVPEDNGCETDFLASGHSATMRAQSPGTDIINDIPRELIPGLDF